MFSLLFLSASAAGGQFYSDSPVYMLYPGDTIQSASPHEHILRSLEISAARILYSECGTKNAKISLRDITPSAYYFSIRDENNPFDYQEVIYRAAPINHGDRVINEFVQHRSYRFLNGSESQADVCFTKTIASILSDLRSVSPDLYVSNTYFYFLRMPYEHLGHLFLATFKNFNASLVGDGCYEASNDGEKVKVCPSSGGFSVFMTYKVSEVAGVYRAGEDSAYRLLGTFLGAL